MFLTDLADVLRDAGLSVTEVEGWKTRGYDGDGDGDPGDDLRGVECIVIHHTATSWSRAGDYPTLTTVRDGRSDVAGPLAQLGLGRSGMWYVIAAGRANHTGATHQAWQSNPYALGVEAEASGVGDPRDWPPAQMASYARGVAALAAHYGVPVDRVLGHKEIAAPTGRKTDPSFDMATFRAAVRNPTTTGGFMPDLTAKQQEELYDAVMQLVTDGDDKITQRVAKQRALTVLRRVNGIVTERVPDVGTKAGLTIAAALGRILTVLRRIEARLIARDSLPPIPADVDPQALAEALATALPPTLAQDVVDALGAQLTK